MSPCIHVACRSDILALCGLSRVTKTMVPRVDLTLARPRVGDLESLFCCVTKTVALDNHHACLIFFEPISQGSTTVLRFKGKVQGLFGKLEK